jgi:hypothetical protein
VEEPNQEVTRQDGDCLSVFDFQLSTLNCLTRIRRNKARMYMKTKDKYKMSLSPEYQARHQLRGRGARHGRGGVGFSESYEPAPG